MDFKNLFKYENKTTLIGLISLLFIIWNFFYLIPKIFASLFKTFLGVLFIALSLLILTYYNYKYGLYALLIVIMIYLFTQTYITKEGFYWTKHKTRDFLHVQHTINRNKIFDIKMIMENQASQEELDYFLKYNVWPWSKNTIELYKENIKRNPYIRNYWGDSVNEARKVYNETAILKQLSYQSKEGQMLLGGILVNQTENENKNENETLPSGFGKTGYNSKLIGHLDKDVIRCKYNNSNDNIYNTNENNASLERITYTGKDGIYNNQTKTISQVDYNDLENIIPGFKFLNGPCNPCSNIDNNTNYSCPFTINIKNDNPLNQTLPNGISSKISNIFKYLWKRDETITNSNNEMYENKYTHPNKFLMESRLSNF